MPMKFGMLLTIHEPDNLPKFWQNPSTGSRAIAKILVFFPDLGEVSISRTNSVPLVGRKLLRQGGQNHTDLVV